MPSDHDDRGPLTPDELAKVRDRYAPCSPWVDGRRLLATVDAERAARERAEQQLAALLDDTVAYVDAHIAYANDDDPLNRLASTVRALLDASTTEEAETDG